MCLRLLADRIVQMRTAADGTAVRLRDGRGVTDSMFTGKFRTWLVVGITVLIAVGVVVAIADISQSTIYAHNASIGYR
jgi:hypothetical protein